MTETIPIRDLSRGQRRDVQRSTEFDDVAEEIVAEVYGLSGLTRDPDWWDLYLKSTGTKYQVKSTSTQIGEDYPAKGRFRVWKGQTRSLMASDAQGTAWYAFVLLDERDGVLRIQRKKPGTVWRIVQDLGGWMPSGHDSMGQQHKLPFSEVF